MNPLAKQKNSLFNFKSFNELKKDQTKLKIFKNSSFDSSFNSVQSLNTNLSHLQRSDCANQIPFSKPDLGEIAAGLALRGPKGGGIGSYPKFSAILRAIRSIRLNRDEWKLIRYLNQMEKKKKIKSRPTFEKLSLKTSAPLPPSLRGSLLPKSAGSDKAPISLTNSFSYTLSPLEPNNLSLSSGEGQLSLLEGESKGVDNTTLLGKEPNLTSYNLKKFNNKKEDIANTRGGVFTKLNPKEKKKLRKLKKELKKFASLLPPVVRGLETPLLNRVAPSRLPCLSPFLRKGGRTKEISKKAVTTLSKNKNNKALALREDNKYNYLKQLIYKFKETQIREGSYKKIFSYNNIISKNILLRNMKFNFLKSTLSTILKKRIRLMSEILEDKPIKHYSLYSYLNFCIFSPPHLKGGITKLSLNKYKGRKLGSFIKYNKIISYNFNSTAPFVATQHPAISKTSLPNLEVGGATPAPQDPFFYLYLSKIKEGRQDLGFDCIFASPKVRPKAGGGKNTNLTSYNLKKFNNKKEGIANIRGNIYIKDTYKLLFYLFKSMYCLISKPVLNYTNDKITIQLFYYLNIPKKKVFRLFSISYINSIKKKWLAPTRASLLPKGWKDGLYPTHPDGLRDKEASQIFTGGWTFLTTLLKPKPEGSNKPFNPSFEPYPERRHARGGRGNPKIYIRWKLRKAISRLKFKIITALGPLGRPLKGGGGKNLLFNLRKFNLTKVYQNKFKLICAILSKKFNKPVELQLIRLHHPYHDSNILVNLLSLNIKNKRKKARVAIQKIYNKKPVKNLNDPNLKKTAMPTAESLTRGTGKLIPAFLSGLNIKIAGRLMGEPIIPRITTKVYGKGATATGKVNYLDVAKITKKNRKGAYTIKITSGQNFF